VPRVREQGERAGDDADDELRAEQAEDQRQRYSQRPPTGSCVVVIVPAHGSIVAPAAAAQIRGCV
jgi:hypothetical protein